MLCQWVSSSRPNIESFRLCLFLGGHLCQLGKLTSLLQTKPLSQRTLHTDGTPLSVPPDTTDLHMTLPNNVAWPRKGSDGCALCIPMTEVSLRLLRFAAWKQGGPALVFLIFSCGSQHPGCGFHTQFSNPRALSATVENYCSSTLLC